ncbi:hypothetical protein EV421DRAFT_1908251 [Armillaria borealis]|uniref:Uncharacterized protein n=1 Tax=Armillaria borealis TaxID=47425 RepID=A0AA39J4K4_9AGAR|nr:hypothetical protein EV421DRAFT_1908251 [Armillaria borealis]
MAYGAAPHASLDLTITLTPLAFSGKDNQLGNSDRDRDQYWFSSSTTVDNRYRLGHAHTKPRLINSVSRLLVFARLKTRTHDEAISLVMVFFDFLGLGFLDLYLQQWRSFNKVEQGIDFGILQAKRGTGRETKVAVQSESRVPRISLAEPLLVLPTTGVSAGDLPRWVVLVVDVTSATRGSDGDNCRPWFPPFPGSALPKLLETTSPSNDSPPPATLLCTLDSSDRSEYESQRRVAP